MDASNLAALASQRPLDPLQLAPASIVLSSQHLGWHDMRFWWRQAPRVEWYAPPLTQHVVTVRLQNAAKLIQVRGGLHYEGPSYKGDALILPAGQPFFWYTEGLDSLSIALEPRLVQRVALETFGLAPERVELRDVLRTRDAVLRHIAQLLWTELHTGAAGGRLYAEALGNMLAVHLLRTYCTQRPVQRLHQGGLPQYQLRRVVEYIDAHLAQPLTLWELAALLQMSEAHFIRAFRQAMGCTPHQYLIQRRIKQAKALLSDSAVPISAVASRVGFQTHSHFTMLFRKLAGVSPTAYRNEQLSRSALHATPDDTQQMRVLAGYLHEELSVRHAYANETL